MCICARETGAGVRYRCSRDRSATKFILAIKTAIAKCAIVSASIRARYGLVDDVLRLSLFYFSEVRILFSGVVELLARIIISSVDYDRCIRILFPYLFHKMI